MFKDFKINFFSKLKNIGNAEFLNDNSQNKTKLPFWDLNLLPIGIVLYRFKRFISLSFLYAVFISILALVTRTGYICGYTDWADELSFGCAKSGGLYISFFLIRLLIISVFLRRWYKTAVCGDYLQMKDLFIITAQDWKIFTSILSVIGILILPLISLFMAIERVPNPDWKIESLFFALIFLLSCCPIFLIRFWGIFSCSVSLQKHDSLKIIWKKTEGQILKIILSIFLIGIICLIINMNYHRLSLFMLEQNVVIGSLLSELFYNVLFLFYSALITSSSIVLNSYLTTKMPEE